MPACGAATAATVAAVASGVSAATGLASGIYKMAQSDDKRPNLGGPDSMSYQAANALSSAYGKPPSQADQLKQGPLQGMGGNNLQAIEQRMGVIGQRLGQGLAKPQTLPPQTTA